MRSLPPEFTNELNKRAGLRPRTFIRMIAKNRSTGAPERLCLWTGIDHQDFTIEGVTDTFYGAGSVVALDDMVHTVGTIVPSYSFKLAQLTPEVIALLRAYDPRGATITIFTGLMSTDTGRLITPTMLRRFKGFVSKAPIKTPSIGGKGSANITCVSRTRNLTRAIPSRRSHENQRRRQANDKFLQYVAISGTVETPWGSKRTSVRSPAKNLGEAADNIRNDWGNGR